MNQHIVQKKSNGILYNPDPIEKTPEMDHQWNFNSFLQRNGFLVRENFLAVSSNPGISVIVFDFLWKIIFCNSLAKKDLVKKETKPIGILLEQFAPLVHKPNSGSGNFNFSWEELANNGLFIGLEFKSYLLLVNGIINLIILTGSPLYDNTGDIVGGVCLYKKILNSST